MSRPAVSCEHLAGPRVPRSLPRIGQGGRAYAIEIDPVDVAIKRVEQVHGVEPCHAETELYP